MNYELAKKLKDAGFPYDYLCCSSCDGKCGKVFEPNLSELISACGEFSSLTKSPRGTWYCARSEGSVEMVVGDEYSTPEEAVARLWLALNKNLLS